MNISAQCLFTDLTSQLRSRDQHCVDLFNLDALYGMRIQIIQDYFSLKTTFDPKLNT